jgi:hypothetical protein
VSAIEDCIAHVAQGSTDPNGGALAKEALAELAELRRRIDWLVAQAATSGPRAEWTTTPPTEHGYYWMRPRIARDLPFVAQLCDQDERGRYGDHWWLMAHTRASSGTDLSDAGFEWWPEPIAHPRTHT